MTMELLNLVVMILGILLFVIGLASLIKPVKFLWICSQKTGMIVMILGIVLISFAGASAYLAKCC